MAEREFLNADVWTTVCNGQLEAKPTVGMQVILDGNRISVCSGAMFLPHFETIDIRVKEQGTKPTYSELVLALEDALELAASHGMSAEDVPTYRKAEAVLARAESGIVYENPGD